MHPAEGDAAAERLWQEYLAVLDGRDWEHVAEPVINPKTGEVDSATEPSSSKQVVFPQPDPVLLAVKTAMAKGALVSLDQVGRSRPSTCPYLRQSWGRSVPAALAALRGV